MTGRVDVIAAALHRPPLRRPFVGHEVRSGVVQLLGRGTDPDWTATIPQLAEAIESALRTSEEKDTPVGGTQPPTGAEFTARAQILNALQAAGRTPGQAATLLAQADREPRHPDPDPDFRETLGGGHALVVEYGDCELVASCQCGKPLGETTPDASVDTFLPGWERHTNTEVT
ncbi:hypothetical protein [Streptomyces caniscabiei]|uniref:Uncharacterized protein n=1 Tax=Streptomyces caniscabiei TaxID=2746961 RepID=A0ABU4MML7_9ACTN|nr:hypothetical protein [Streptomyces caniscabiei]MBE4790971.1 hypothetical protein [Streptomyces caniscabiei]MDX3009598.1 hypothetical protein [Streptomyces caniscabiei]MDX3037243.1 hypothetical protein [Streptomyces caniscabiei]